MSIKFFTEDISFILNNEKEKSLWINKVIQQEGFSLGELNYIFCSDEYLLNINQTYLNHDTYTDIITFDQSEEPQEVSGDIFISIPRILDNARKFKVDETDELDRVLIHGVLHLMGYLDKTPEDEANMRKKEEACLSLR